MEERVLSGSWISHLSASGEAGEAVGAALQASRTDTRAGALDLTLVCWDHGGALQLQFFL